MLNAHRFFSRVSLLLGGVFVWIFVLSYCFGITHSIPLAFAGAALVYAISQIVVLACTPLAAAHMHNAPQSMVWAMLSLASSYILLGSLFEIPFGAGPAWGVACFALLHGLYRAFYWIPYTIEQERAPTPFPLLYEIIICYAPLFAGLTLITQPFPAVRILFGAAVFALCSTLPAFFLPRLKETFSWSLSETFTRLFAREYRSKLLHSILAGIEGAVLFFIWPIAAFIILEFSFPSLGLVYSITLLCILALREWYQRIARRLELHEAPLLHSITRLGAWVGRAASGAPITMILVNTFSFVTAPTQGITSDPFTLDQYADGGHFLDEYTALKEMGIAIGKLLCACFAAILVLAMPIVTALLVTIGFAAIVSILSALAARAQ